LFSGIIGEDGDRGEEGLPSNTTDPENRDDSPDIIVYKGLPGDRGPRGDNGRPGYKGETGTKGLMVSKPLNLIIFY